MHLHLHLLHLRLHLLLHLLLHLHLLLKLNLRLGNHLLYWLLRSFPLWSFPLRNSSGYVVVILPSSRLVCSNLPGWLQGP